MRRPTTGPIAFLDPEPNALWPLLDDLRAAGWRVVSWEARCLRTGRARVTAFEPLHGAELRAALLAEEAVLCHLDVSTSTTQKETP